MSESVTYDADGRLAADLECAQCRHNLRGLPADGNCGECGAPVNWTLRGSGLNAADPEWLGRLRSGVAIVTTLTLWVWIPLAWPIYALGLWKLSTPDPADRDSRGVVMRQGLRIACTWGLGLATGILLFAFNVDASHWPTWIPVWVSEDSCLLFVATCYCLTLALVSAWLWRVGRRADSRALRRRPMIVGALSLVAAASFACWGLHSLQALDLRRFAVLFPVLSLGAALLIPALVLFCIMMIAAWRLLRVAEVQARALRRELKVWQGPPPGAAWRSREARPDADEASADQAEA